MRPEVGASPLEYLIYLAMARQPDKQITLTDGGTVLRSHFQFEEPFPRLSLGGTNLIIDVRSVSGN